METQKKRYPKEWRQWRWLPNRGSLSGARCAKIGTPYPAQKLNEALSGPRFLPRLKSSAKIQTSVIIDQINLNKTVERSDFLT